MPSYAFWFLALVGTPIVAYSSFHQFASTYILVLLTSQALLACCDCIDHPHPSEKVSSFAAPKHVPPTPNYPVCTSIFAHRNHDPVYSACSNHNSIQSAYSNHDPVYSTHSNHAPVYSAYSNYDSDYSDYSNHDTVYSTYSYHNPVYSALVSGPKYSPIGKRHCGEYLHGSVEKRAGKWYQYNGTLHDTSSNVIRNKTRSVVGRFTCNYPNCPSITPRTWKSAGICTQVLLTADGQYKAVIHAQECKFCNKFALPVIDAEAYAQRIVSALDLWTGRREWTGKRERLEPNENFGSTWPHDTARCHGCQQGICSR